jgi:hypothetical protein
MSDKTKKALQILADNPGLTASGFASLMWPDSDGWRRVKNTGHGATRGKGMWLSAGGYLAKLRKIGLVDISISRQGQTTFKLTSEGRKLLAAN